ncbi:MAG: GAF domain-containing protein [Anaerolineales bacterium]|nr:MAG: GAF domain-containing protein [Anaerolineales bacterium]
MNDSLKQSHPARNLRKVRLALETLSVNCEGSQAAIARDALNDLEQVEQHQGAGEQARLAALFKVCRALGSSLQLSEVLRETMDSVIQLTGAERGFLMLANQETGELTFQAARNFQQENLNKNKMEVSRSIIQDVIRSGEGVLTTNAQIDDRFSKHDSITRFALRSILCLPLQTHGEVMGVIYIDNKIKSGAFNEDDQKLLDVFAAQAAVAIENARLYSQVDTELAKRISELETLRHIDKELNTGLDFKRVLELTLEWALRSTRSDDGCIGLIDNVGSLSVLAGDCANELMDASDPRLAPALHKGQAVTFQQDGNFYALIVPARREERTIALIGVRRREKAYSKEAENFLFSIAERAALAIENTRLFDAARAADDAKSQFISIVTHELKIPMTSIRGYADLIRQGTVGPVTDQQMEFLDTIRSNVDRMANLVSDISDISRIETGRLKIDLAAIPIADYIYEIAAGFRPQFDAKKQSIEFSIEDGLPMVQADRNRLAQILTNLLSNANKYTPEGGSIAITASFSNNFVRTEIRDTGIGLNNDDQAMLFSQFFRSEEPAVRNEIGWGLGLHVTHRLVKLMGGEIGVQSKPGEGSIFWFTLPAIK